MIREISGAIGAIILIVFVLSARHRRRIAVRRPQGDPNAELLAAMQQQNAILMEMLRRQGGSGHSADDNPAEEPLLIPEWRPTPDQRARMTLGLPLEGPISRAQVRKAYKKAVRAAHPDQGGSAEAFREVRDAFDHFKL